MARQKGIHYARPHEGAYAAERAMKNGNCPRAVQIFGYLSRDMGAGHKGSDEAVGQVFSDLIHYGCVKRMR